MNRILLTHQWKALWRSRGKNKAIATNILIGFLVLYFLFTAIVIGFALDPLLEKHFGAGNAVHAFCGFILYYFAIDIYTRFQFQELPTIALQPYLLQNIRRSQLLRFLNLRSLFSFFNIVPLLLFMPFTIITIYSQFGIVSTLGFIASIFGICFGNHFLILFLKRKTENSNKWLLAFFITSVILIGINYFKIISIRDISAWAFTGILHKPWCCILPLVYVAFSFYLNRRLLLDNFYFESTASNSDSRLQSHLLNKLTTQGSLIGMEVKLILRNKRTRTILFKSFIFLAYGFIVFRPHELANNEFILALTGSTIVVGVFTINYGEFLLGWQSAYFDGLMTNNINFKTFIKSKFRILTLICSFSFLLSLLYGFLDWHLPIILFAIYLFTIGVLPVIAGYFATINYKGVDLSKASSFKTGGTSMAQFLYSLATIIITILLYLPFQIYKHSWLGIAFIGIIGLVNFLLQNWWVDLLYKQFLKNRYKILEGFREK